MWFWLQYRINEPWSLLVLQLFPKWIAFHPAGLFGNQSIPHFRRFITEIISGQSGLKIAGFPGLLTVSHFLWYLSALRFPWLGRLQRVKAVPCILRVVGGIWTLIWCRLSTHLPLCPFSSFLCPSLSLFLSPLLFLLHLFKKVNIKFKKPKQRERERESSLKRKAPPVAASSYLDLTGAACVSLCS